MNTQQVYNNNLEYFKKYWAEAYEIVQNTDATNIKINVTNNDVNFFIDDRPLYPEDTSTHLGRKIEDFFTNPKGFYKRATVTDKNPNISPIDDSFMVKLESHFPEAMEDKSAYDTHLDSIPVLLMFGIGTGQQIQQLLSLIDIKHLIIIDENYSMLKASMYITDWRPILKHFVKKGNSIEFKIGSDPKDLGSHTINTLYATKMFFSYYVNFFITYKTSFMQKAFNQIKDNYHSIQTGWGFYDDELMSLNHTIRNINDKRAIFVGNKDIPKDSTVFIVASGPSLDKDIETIKKFKDKVVIFSCSTALKVLEVHGIVPDYHVEKERTPSIYYKLLNAVSKDFMKQVNFIGLNVIYHEVFDLFKTTKMFFRENDTGSSISIPNTPLIHHCNPTSFNMALAFASELEFKNIYIFGADMGYRDESNHHSKDTIYSDSATKSSKWKPSTLDETLIGNFNNKEKILTTSVLTWSKQRAQNCISDYTTKKNKEINYYNCSDGAFIEKTIPTRSKDINIDDKVDKSKIISSIENNFDHNFKKINKKVKQRFQIQKDFTTKAAEDIIDIITKEKVTSYSQFFSIMEISFNIIFLKGPTEANRMTLPLVKGTMVRLFNIIYTHALMAKNIEDSFIFINYGLQIVVEYLQKVKKDMSNFKIALK